jgi:putative transposase
MSAVSIPRTSERVLIEVQTRRAIEGAALRAFLKAADLLGLALGKVIAEYRSQDDPLLAAAATIAELRGQLAAARIKIDILHDRMVRIPARARPHHTPRRRFDILEVKALLRESAATTADWARVSVNTILRWEKVAAERPERSTVGSLLKPTPPVRRFADAERRLAQWMHRMGFPGGGSISRALLRAGRRMSPRTVQRIQNERPMPAPPPAQAGHVEARYPNHVWMADVTEIPALFRIFSFKLLLIFDVFSRFPVAARLSLWPPNAEEMRELFDRAACPHGVPRHFVSDRGRPFRTKQFARTLRQRGVKQRFGAIGQHGSIALVERLFKTLKYDFSLRHPFTLSREAVERRLNLILTYYSYLRPHQSLAAATPAERYFGIRPEIHAVPPRRGRRGEVTEPPPLDVVHLDPEHRQLPVLVPNAA